MPISVVWDDADETVIRLDYIEPILSWQEYDDAIDAAYALAKSAQQPVGLIHNPGKASMPRGSAFPHIRRAMRLMPSNVRLTAAVVANPFARTLVPLILQGDAGERLKFAANLDHARDLMHEMRH